MEGGKRAEAAVLEDGSRLAVNWAVVRIGIPPSVALAERAGLAIDNGIAVDRRGRT